MIIIPLVFFLFTASIGQVFDDQQKGFIDGGL
jgi:hypothetical protein